jgi:hypothetical protein
MINFFKKLNGLECTYEMLKYIGILFIMIT